jgi:hypothetical protein
MSECYLDVRSQLFLSPGMTFVVSRQHRLFKISTMARTLQYLVWGIAALAAAVNAAPSCPAPSNPPNPGTAARTFQAEDGKLSGTTVDTAQTGYTGKKLTARCELT